ncbi:ran-binding protein 3 [Colias croceus]|uniref:ran-binding protein 3 n=1 Tax=Colias crocea TaxID=72248 RepID=UPI001E27D2A1|nr:ran-binding protein 3 [Colias croceus]
MADAKQGKPSEDIYNGTQSRIVLAKPKLGGFGASGFAASSNKGNNPFGSLLRPSQLKPASNPFSKVTTDDLSPEKKKEKENEADSTNETRLQETEEGVETPKFVPLGSANVTPRTNTTVPAPVGAATSTSSTGFVFGQNLSERVVMKESVNNGDASPAEHSSSNGTANLLFTTAAATVLENHQDEPGPSESRTESLAAAAAEYERSHARPPPPTSNCTMTGEEDEVNVLQISCRLFAWESGSWRERGRGVLRLNDAACGGARLVARVAGSLRVVLNTKLWPDMVVERAGAKSLRITAADAQLQIKLFLIMGAPGDIAQLHRALLARIARSKRISNSKDDKNQRHDEIDVDEGKSVDDDDYIQDDGHDDGNDDGHDDDSDEDAANKINQDKPDGRLEADSKDKTENEEATESVEEKESKALKRKEPVEDETSPKRQCQDVLIQ